MASSTFRPESEKLQKFEDCSFIKFHSALLNFAEVGIVVSDYLKVTDGAWIHAPSAG